MGGDHTFGTAQSILSRRAVLGAAPAFCAASASADVAAPLQLGRSADERLIYRKLRFRTDSGLLFWWIRGPHLGEINGELTPLYGINLGAIQRVSYRTDGSFEVRDLEISFTTDIETGKRLESFRNPLTGEVLPVPTPPPRPFVSHYSADNALSAPSEIGGARFEVKHFPAAPFGVGSDIYLRDRTRAKISMPGRPPRILNELSTFIADRESVLSPNSVSAPSRVISNDVSTWDPWLNMGDRPGLMALYGVGRKVGSFNEMPADWLRMVAEDLPSIAADPIAALDGSAV